MDTQQIIAIVVVAVIAIALIIAGVLADRARKKRIDATSAQCLLATGIRDTVIYLPMPTDAEQGYLFQLSASNRFHVEGELSHETYYYWSKYEK